MRTLARACLGPQTRNHRFRHKRKRRECGHRQGCEIRGASSAQGRRAPSRVSSPGCIQHPAALGDAASNHRQAAFLSYITTGEKRGNVSRYWQKGRTHHLNFIVLSLESLSIPQYPGLQTCNDAACVPHWKAANLDSLLLVACFRTLNWHVLKKRNTLGTKHVDNTDAYTKYASIKA